jgi:hypothetical protein
VRFVRVTDDLWAELEIRFPEERPGNGEPSLHDFASTTLVEIHRRFSEEWDALAATVKGRTEYRALWGSGPYVAGYVAHGQLAPDGHIDLTSIEVDLYPPEDDTVDD